MNVIPSTSQASLDEIEMNLSQCKVVPVPIDKAVSANYLVAAFVTSDRRVYRAKLIHRHPGGRAMVWLIDHERMITADEIAEIPAHLHPNIVPPFVIK